ncbi:MAG: hypothetical protein GXP40_07175 [Chloroflexi bacterium]|nr:hypothetical protein [Chloroflexota bacterium]
MKTLEKAKEWIKTPFRSSERKIFFLLFVSLAVSFPLYFENAFEYSLPMGYAGMFAQMAKQIADLNFRLPLETPFYGPGGIPFAYPPLALYFLAVPIRLTGKYFFFLHWLPPLLSLMALIPLFFLVLELSESSLAAASSVILTATSRELYIAHAWSAGIVRSLAFTLALFSIFFFMRHLRNQSKGDMLLAGIFLGLVTLTHLEYAVFSVLWLGFWTLFEKQFFYAAKNLFVIFGIGFLIALLWIVPILSRYGMSTLLNALNSHGNARFLSAFGGVDQFLSFILIKFSVIKFSPLFLFFLIVGIIALIRRKERRLIVFYVFLTIILPGEKFSGLVGAMIVAVGLAFSVEMLRSRCNLGRNPKLAFVSAALILLPVLGYFWWDGFDRIKRLSPKIDSQTLDLASQVQRDLLPEQKYLALLAQDEAEWMPFLFQREPLVAQWGSEWLGTYDQQTRLMSLFRTCQKQEDWTCVQDVIRETKKSPDYLITYLDDQNLNEQISANQEWTEKYSNKRYVLWQFAQAAR